MNYLIDLRTASDKKEIHDLLTRALELPPHYGRNLDALWDCLTSELCIPCEIHLTVGTEASPYLQALLDLFERAQAWHARRGHAVQLYIKKPLQ